MTGRIGAVRRRAGVAARVAAAVDVERERERRVAGAAPRRRRVVADRVRQSRLRDVAGRRWPAAATAVIRRLRKASIPATAGESTLSRRSRAPAWRSSSKPSIARRASACGFTRRPPQGELPPVHDKHNLASASPGHRRRARLRVVRHRTDRRARCERQAGVVEASRQGVRRLRHQLGPRQLAGVVPGHDHPALLSHAGARTLLALDKRTGAVKWKIDKPAGVGVVQLADRRAAGPAATS